MSAPRNRIGGCGTNVVTCHQLLHILVEVGVAGVRDVGSLLAKARQILVSELALAEKTDEDKAEAILDEVLAS